MTPKISPRYMLLRKEMITENVSRQLLVVTRQLSVAGSSRAIEHWGYDMRNTYGMHGAFDASQRSFPGP